MKFTVTIADDVGDKTAENAVIPIRLSETTINGFKYSDFNPTFHVRLDGELFSRRNAA